MWEQSAQNTPNSSKALGYATILHPFHPLRGQSFPILKIRTVNGIRRYSLQSGNDIFSVPESWLTDMSASEFAGCYFNADAIRELSELAELISD